MSEQHPKSSFQLNLDPETAKKFLQYLSKEGLMQAGFSAQEGTRIQVDIKEVTEDSKTKRE
jgi:hypothetical protein